VHDEVYHQSPDDGLSTLAEYGLRGFMWNYLLQGQTLDDQPSIWFLLMGFNSDWDEINNFQRKASDLRLFILPCEDIVETETVPVARYISATFLIYPEQSAQLFASELRKAIAKRFLDLGGVKTPLLIMSSAPCPSPFVWGDPDIYDLGIPVDDQCLS
jgi:hypothetical protein